ncbi:prolipoprotein diacylglyceryl transferase 1 [Actinocatenispora thailandica]|uniref:Phosphatidylglycerol--prolipoprotein diacylglyceryl transferase n=1 Tax=Actinocatenispora thailandica TaxID=227318 RepID=A0A7R7DNX6_9ACTN|nr:prolipoprotein diacylglyceryl transferase [Actinocatenispora thailandica]BCJ34996.1 prolipoprotein diacylglyceryl transferase 1 [Actinocatenispora thailandica]
MNLASIPSPTQSVVHLGPLPIRAYALCIVAGIVLACVITERRLRARGAPPWTVLDIAVWAVPFGIVGARLYHVITDPELYFTAGRDWVGAFKIWDGGLGIWGAVAGGALGAWIACRRRGLPLSVVADALAPGLPVAQAIGRWGNWFNQELYGKPTNLPWAVHIDPAHRIIGYEQYATYQPTFLYECVWDLLVALAVWLLDRRFRFGRGRAFALYVALYVFGRFWVESLRIDHANTFFGLRLNDWVSIVVFIAAVLYVLLMRGPRLNVVADASGRLTVVPEGGATAASAETVVDKADAEALADTGASEPEADSDPGDGGSGAKKPDPDHPDADTPDADTPDADTPDADTPDADTPDADTPDADAPDADAPEPDAPEPDAPEPDAPGADAPDADAVEPGTPDDGAAEARKSDPAARGVQKSDSGT